MLIINQIFRETSTYTVFSWKFAEPMNNLYTSNIEKNILITNRDIKLLFNTV